jgi:hypothetical protein
MTIKKQGIAYEDVATVYVHLIIVNYCQENADEKSLEF